MAVVALAYLDQQHAPFGALEATAAGWKWWLVAAYRDTVSNKKEVLTGISVDTLDGDNLAQVGTKLAAGVKAFGTGYGLTATTVVLPTFTLVSVP